MSKMREMLAKQLPAEAATKACSSSDSPLFRLMLPPPGTEKPRVPSEFEVNFNWLGSVPCSRKASAVRSPVSKLHVRDTAPDEASTSALKSMSFCAMSTSKALS